MRKLLIIIAVLQFAPSGVLAQSESAARAEMLFLEQKTKISQLVSPRMGLLGRPRFSIAVDAVVPVEVHVQSLPAEVEQIAPQVGGLGYVMIEEQIALIDQHSRKVAIVLPRWLEP